MGKLEREGGRGKEGEEGVREWERRGREWRGREWEGKDGGSSGEVLVNSYTAFSSN